MEPASQPRSPLRCVGIAILLLLTACQGRPPGRPTPTAIPTVEARELWPAFHLWVEGTGPAFLTLSRDDLPISLSLTGENASGWLALHEQGSEIRAYSVAPPAGREPNLVIVSLDLEDVIPIQVKAEGSWRLFSSYLGRGSFMEIPGRMSGSGPHLLFFTLGDPRYVRVEADPGEGTFALLAIGGDFSSDIIAASTRQVSDVFPLSPELRGLQIRTDGTWTIHVVDRADILD